jgi:hypothetical protein
VINFGTAGSRRHPTGACVECHAFVQRDMDVSGLGVPLGTTPFDAGVPVRLEFPPVFAQLTPAVCGTGDSFATDRVRVECDVLDMEGYALAKVCWLERTRFTAVKWVTDGADHDGWRRLAKPTCTTRPSASCSCTNTSRRRTHECPQRPACAPAVRRCFLRSTVGVRCGIRCAAEDRHRRHRQHRRRARQALGEAGHELVISSRHPEELQALAKSLGPKVRVGTPLEAAQFGDVVLLSVPYKATSQVGQDLASAWKGKIVLDTGNPYPMRDGTMALMRASAAPA